MKSFDAFSAEFLNSFSIKECREEAIKICGELREKKEESEFLNRLETGETLI